MPSDKKNSKINPIFPKLNIIFKFYYPCITPPSEAVKYTHFLIGFNIFTSERLQFTEKDNMFNIKIYKHFSRNVSTVTMADEVIITKNNVIGSF